MTEGFIRRNVSEAQGQVHLVGGFAQAKEQPVGLLLDNVDKVQGSAGCHADSSWDEVVRTN